MTTARREVPVPASAAPWRRWARRTAVTRLTTRQAYAVALIQTGFTDSPEAGLRQIQKEKPAAETAGGNSSWRTVDQTAQGGPFGYG